MLKNTFIMLPGVNEKSENNIWNQGVLNHSQFLQVHNIKGISRMCKMFFDTRIIEAQRNYNNSSYFAGKISNSEMWRCYDQFKDDAVYLDIEVSSVDEDGYITIVGLFDGITTKTMVKDINLDMDGLGRELAKYQMIVSFNGSIFDAPFINKRYPNVLPKIPHFDLRFACARVGLTGGLKQIEKSLGIVRENEIVDKLYSGDPFRLWKMFRATGDEYYLNLLIEYNEEDVINLNRISEIVYQKLVEKVKI